jgi:hypothetical protein
VGNTGPISILEGSVAIFTYDQTDAEPAFLYRGLDIYLNVKQITEYTSDEPWGWYKAPSKI